LRGGMILKKSLKRGEGREIGAGIHRSLIRFPSGKRKNSRKVKPEIKKRKVNGTRCERGAFQEKAHQSET